MSAREKSGNTEQDPGVVRRELEVELDPDGVWELLVDDEERADWFGGPTTLEPVPGGTADFTDPDGTRRTATVEEALPGRRLCWTWWPVEEGPDGERTSRVDIELEPSPGGTRISVTEAPLVPVASASATSSRMPTWILDLELRALLRGLTVRA